MRRRRVLNVRLLQPDVDHTLRRERNVIVSFGSMPDDQPVRLFQIFERPDEIGVRILGSAVKQLFRQHLRLLSFLKEAQNIALNALESLLFHAYPIKPCS